MVVHADREHAVWSASSTERNWACPGALALTMDLPDRTSEAADWGTACHQISERCLRTDKDAAEFIGTTEKGKEHSFEVDEEMAETAQTYVDYVRAVRDFVGAPDNRLYIEQRFSLASLNPPFDAGGTADAVVFVAATKTLEVIDLKGGRGHVVEAVGNPQLRTYALGAMLANKGLPVDTVKVTIVQPRAPHKSGRIRSESFHVIDLVEWTSDLLAAMGRAKAASIEKNHLHNAMWARKFLNAGDHCKFCKAAGFCPALQQKAYDAAAVWFDDQDQPRLSNSPDTMSAEAIAQALLAADMIGDWINAVRAYAHAQAESGVEIPGFILVPKEGRETWIDGGGEKAAAAAKEAGLDEAKIFNPGKVRTPKQLRDALTKAGLKDAAAALTGLSGKPDKGTNLVAADKTTREAVRPAVEQHFDILN